MTDIERVRVSNTTICMLSDIARNDNPEKDKYWLALESLYQHFQLIGDTNVAIAISDIIHK